MKKGLFQDKVFYGTLFSIALPITIQNLISSGLNMVDTVMIGKLGEVEIAAVGLGNKLFFLYVLLLFGTYSGAGIFISQFWGKKDISNIRKVLGICLMTGLFASLLFTVAGFVFPSQVLSIFSTDPEVIQVGSGYLRIVSLSYGITAVSFAYGFTCRSIGKATLPMYVSAGALLCNTFLNYVLIFGYFGFPRLGVNGAAIATVFSRILEMVLLVGLIYAKKYVLAAKIGEMLDISKEFAQKFFRTILPVILNEGMWALGVIMYAIAYARMGTTAIATVQVADTVQSFFIVVFFGMANACAVMIGNQIGAGDEESAKDYAKKFAILGPGLAVIMGVLLVLLAPMILTQFDIQFDDAYRTLLVLAFFLPFKIYNLMAVVGILRSGGDTKFALLLDIGGVWFIGIPLAFLGALVWKLPIYWVVALVSLEELAKNSLAIPRVISNKWVRNVVEHMDV